MVMGTFRIDFTLRCQVEFRPPRIKLAELVDKEEKLIEAAAANTTRGRSKL